MTQTLTPPATAASEWVMCVGCRAVVYGKRWERLLRVCPECGRHYPLDVPTRLASLADPGSLQLLELPLGTVSDVLGFVDTKPYPQRIAEARAATGLDGAVTAATMTIDGTPVVVAAMDFAFLGGSLGSLAGEVLVTAADTAVAMGCPLLAVTASGGARMQEGAISLMQMARTGAAWARMDEAGLLTVSLITDPTYGGVAASFATLSDVIIAEAGARLGFAGRRVIEQTIRQKLPPEFQTVEYLRERGFVDLVVAREQLRAELGRILRVGASRRGRRHRPETSPLVRDPGLLPETEPWQQVQRARDLRRPTLLDYAALAFDDLRELHGDRVSGDCPAMVAGFACLGGEWVALIGQQKGHTPAELAERNFGMPNPAGYRKAARVMRLAAKLRVPIVTLVDTPGAYPGALAEEQGQAWAIAENLRLMASLPVPIVTVVTGEGGSGGALGIAVANRVLIFEHAVYSVISPEGCASILWNDATRAPQAAAALGLSSRDLLRLGVVDGVIPESAVGVGEDAAAADLLKAALLTSLAELAAMTPQELVRDRRERFARFGTGGFVAEAACMEVASAAPASVRVSANGKGH